VYCRLRHQIKSIALGWFLKETISHLSGILRQEPLCSHIPKEKQASLAGRFKRAKSIKFKFNRINNNRQNTKGMLIEPLIKSRSAL